MKHFTDVEIALYGYKVCAEVERRLAKQERYMTRCSVCEKRFGLTRRECCHRYLCDVCHGYTCRHPVSPETPVRKERKKKQQEGEQGTLF